MSEPTIEYRPNPKPDPDTDRRVLLGGYYVSFDDGFRAFLPHTGWHGTVSAEPLDVEDEEDRSIILREAQRMREDYDPARSS